MILWNWYPEPVGIRSKKEEAGAIVKNQYYNISSPK
jgi:hypothetical protein